MGISATRNKMLDMARGRYIAVMDHDDLCRPKRFATQLAVMEGDPSIGVCGTGQKRFGRLFKGDVIRYPERDADIRAALFFKCVIHHPSAMIRKSVLDQYSIRYDETLVSGNDRVLYLDISEHATLRNVPDVLCLYRLHAGMTSRTKRHAIVEEQKKIRDLYLQKIGTNLPPTQRDILNDYVASGRARIKSAETLAAIDDVLTRISAANAHSGYLPRAEFDRMCAQYLVKRCVNAMWYGRISSSKLLKKTALPVQDIRLPRGLCIFNILKN